MKNNYLFILCFLFSVISSNVFSQEFIEAYYVTHEGDTVSGWIQDKTDVELQSLMEFKGSLTDEVRVFKPQEIVAFGLGDHRSFQNIPVEKSEKEVAHVFGRQIANGKIDLYTWEDLNYSEPCFYLVNRLNNRYIFLLGPGNKLVTDENGFRYVKEGKEYIQLINWVQADSMHIYPIEHQFNYAVKPIQKQIVNYNKSFEKEFAIADFARKITWDYTLKLGAIVYAINPLDQNNLSGLSLKLSLFAQRVNPERNRGFSYLVGISNQYWIYSSADKQVADDLNENYFKDVISLYPIGFSAYMEKGSLTPYFFLAGGVSVIVSSKYMGNKSGADRSKDNYVIVYPGVIMGVGVKKQLGKHQISLELSQTSYPLDLGVHVGYTF